MAVEMREGVWKRRDMMAVVVSGKTPDGFWQCSDGFLRYDDGRRWAAGESQEDVVEWLGVPTNPEPEPEPDAAEELAALKDDRDRWQARAKQAEGQASNLAQELVRVRGEARQSLEALNDMRGQLTAAQEVVVRQRQGWEDLQQQLSNRVRQVSDLQAQLEAAAHLPDLRGDLERVAAERDAAREELRGLQVRAEQAEGDARNATAKMRHHEAEASRWRAQVTIKNDTLIRTEAAVDALRSVILDLFERMRNDD